jgi:neutral trehalase
LASNRFRVKDLLFNCVYAQNLMALSRLCQAGSGDEAELFRSRAQASEAAILSKMYHAESGLFFSLDTRSGQERQIKVSTVSSLLPLILDSIGQPQVDLLIRGYLTNPSEFWANYPVPAQPVSAPARGKLHIWRGQQTWVYTNWLIVQGLRKQARRFPQQRQYYDSVAAAITNKTCQLVEREGFREYYDSRTGQGCRARNFGWSALVLDMVYNK